jgi:hypothetical protein
MRGSCKTFQKQSRESSRWTDQISLLDFPRFKRRLAVFPEFERRTGSCGCAHCHWSHDAHEDRQRVVVRSPAARLPLGVWLVPLNKLRPGVDLSFFLLSHVFIFCVCHGLCTLSTWGTLKTEASWIACGRCGPMRDRVTAVTCTTATLDSAPLRPPTHPTPSLPPNGLQPSEPPPRRWLPKLPIRECVSAHLTASRDSF